MLIVPMTAPRPDDGALDVIAVQRSRINRSLAIGGAQRHVDAPNVDAAFIEALDDDFCIAAIVPVPLTQYAAEFPSPADLAVGYALAAFAFRLSDCDWERAGAVGQLGCRLPMRNNADEEQRDH